MTTLKMMINTTETAGDIARMLRDLAQMIETTHPENYIECSMDDDTKRVGYLSIGRAYGSDRYGAKVKETRQ